jgi:hypothetical protein
MKRIDFKSLGAGVLLGAGAMLAIAATGSTRNVPMEYQVVAGNVHNDLVGKMNRLGGDNWELVGTSGVGDQYAYAIFKRPKQ